MASAPTHKIFAVTKNNSSGKSFWYEIGAGWQNEKGILTTTFHALPANGTDTVIIPVEQLKKNKSKEVVEGTEAQ